MHGTSISHRLILNTILIVITAIVIGGLPAIWAIWLQLENQVWERVQHTQTTTLSLYDAERDRIETLAGLVAQDQALCILLQHGDMPGLAAYLEKLSQGVNLDVLSVITSDQRWVGYATIELSLPDELFINRGIPFADFIVQNNPSQLVILAAREVQPSEDCEDRAVAWLIAARVLDDDFMQAVAQQTGMDHSLIIDQRRIATSLSNASDEAVNPNTTLIVLRKGTSCCTKETRNDELYYLNLAPLRNSTDDIVALSEVALPGGAMRAGAIQTIMWLFVLGVVVAIGGSMFAVILTRRITWPLTRLSESAEQMGAGDLEPPIIIGSGLTEIDQLAAHLEHARYRLQSVQLAEKSERERIEHLLEVIHDGVIVLDDGGYVTFFNPAAERILGLTSRDVMGTHYSKVFRPAPGETIPQLGRFHPLAGAAPMMHLTIIGMDERPITLAITTSWLTDNDGGSSSPKMQIPGQLSSDQSRACVLVMRDISEEQAIMQLRSNFLANVSHEFRTPLSAVIATTEVLIEEGSEISSVEILELANSIRLGALRLQTLIDNLLESATIDAGRFQVRCRPAQLQSILDSCIQTMAPLLKRRNQELKLEIQTDLTPIWADPERLAQVLINLLANASRFGPMGMPITLSAHRDHDSIKISLLESVPRLPAGRFSDLCTRFGTGEQPGGALYGIGLGLSVVKAIVEAHGGQVGAENRAEGGARVWFTLPLEPPEGC